MPQQHPPTPRARATLDVPEGTPAFVSRERILRIRQVMPEESPIDLDQHAAMIAYDVERQGSYAQVLKRREASIKVTRDYVESVRRFLDEVRETSSRFRR